jgi:hypothetical protein
MALNAATAPMASGPKQEPIAVGTYMARLVQVIDLGLQPQEFNGQQKEPKREVNLTYELTNVFMKDENGNDDTTKPRWVGESFPLNNMKADLAKSTKRIKAIDPENKYNGDLIKMLNMPCLVTIVHNVSKKNGNVYSNISMVSPPMAGMPVPELKNEPRWFDLEAPDVKTFLSLPEFIQNKIKANLEFPKSKLDKLLNSPDGAASSDSPQEPREDMNEMDDAPF